MRAIHRISPQAIGSDDRILEVGGGRSGLASYLYPGADIITLDIDPAYGLHYLQAAQTAQSARSHFVCADARRLPFPDGYFTVVTLFDVLEHIEDDELAAREALRVTRKGGCVLVSTPDSQWRYPYYSLMARFCPHESELMREWGHVRRGYSIAELERLVGLPVAASATFINPITAFYHDIAFSRLRRRYQIMLYALTALPTAIAYTLHGKSMPGTEAAVAWKV
ncbi:MAG: class I SAM-dependent methyltransferase [Spongiibacteraceae bacterium]